MNPLLNLCLFTVFTVLHLDYFENYPLLQLCHTKQNHSPSLLTFSLLSLSLLFSLFFISFKTCQKISFFFNIFKKSKLLCGFLLSITIMEHWCPYICFALSFNVWCVHVPLFTFVIPCTCMLFLNICCLKMSNNLLNNIKHKNITTWSSTLSLWPRQ